MKKRWDIFCKVVDNFGDIGVCWRLAKQLNDEHGLQIKLWVDDLQSAKKIIINLNVNLNQQVVDKIDIEKWDVAADFSQAADVVIEGFSCGLPTPYLAALVQKKSKWINLEYLSAESWVNDFHAKPSPQANNLVRHFYFPGFTDATGGLIRERSMLAFNQQLDRDDGNALKISLFCYPNSPIKDLLSALQTTSHEALVCVPQSSILPKIAEFFGKTSIKVGEKFTKNNLTVEILPFLSQADYDKLLSECDLNFVRGEDSWIRAIWAAKPFIWQPYFQEEKAHIAKLNAFLDLFYVSLAQKKVLCEAHECWSKGQLPQHILQAYLDYLATIKAYTLQQSQQLAKQTDLAAKLVIFCNKI